MPEFLTPVEHPVPLRPAGVPDDAAWNPFAEAWEHGAIDGSGSRQGEWRSWRADGSLLAICPYTDHEPDGLCRRFHPDGSTASEATWKAGRRHDWVLYRATAETDEPWILGGGADVVRAVYTSEDGRSDAAIRLFDADGVSRDAAGAPEPPRPDGVPETARCVSGEDAAPPDGSPGGWVDGRIERATRDKLGTWRWWSNTGRLLRTELYTEAGRRIAVVPAGAPDPVEEWIARFYALDKGDGYKLIWAWTPALHERIRADLPSLPVAVTAEYIAVLRAGIHDRYRGWTVPRPQSRLIVSIVEDWEARAPADAADAETWYIVGAGARAAYDVGDRERLARWWPRFESILMPQALRESTHAFKVLAGELAGKGELRAMIAAAVDGTEAAKRAATAVALATPATAALVSNEEIALFAEVALGCMRCEVMIRDRETGEVWLHDAENRSHYFDGRSFAPSTVQFDRRSRHDAEYVAAYVACDERILFWPGSHGWLLLQRYGRAVLWHAACYYESRCGAEVEHITWFKAASPAEASRMMGLIGAAQPEGTRRIHPWYDEELGLIRRTYSGRGLAEIELAYDTLTSQELLVEELASHAEAVVAFEQIEIGRMRNGHVLERLTALANDDE